MAEVLAADAIFAKVCRDKIHQLKVLIRNTREKKVSWQYTIIGMTCGSGGFDGLVYMTISAKHFYPRSIACNIKVVQKYPRVHQVWVYKCLLASHAPDSHGFGICEVRPDGEGCAAMIQRFVCEQRCQSCSRWHREQSFKPYWPLIKRAEEEEDEEPELPESESEPEPEPESKKRRLVDPEQWREVFC